MLMVCLSGVYYIIERTTRQGTKWFHQSTHYSPCSLTARTTRQGTKWFHQSTHYSPTTRQGTKWFHQSTHYSPTTRQGTKWFHQSTHYSPCSLTARTTRQGTKWFHQSTHYSPCSLTAVNSAGSTASKRWEPDCCGAASEHADIHSASTVVDYLTDVEDCLSDISSEQTDVQKCSYKSSSDFSSSEDNDNFVSESESELCAEAEPDEANCKYDKSMIRQKYDNIGVVLCEPWVTTLIIIKKRLRCWVS